MCLGGSDDSSSREMINMQKEEAAAARKKEAERQARIKSGLTRISGAFEGTPVMGTRPAKFKFTAPATGAVAGGAVAGLPKGFTYVAGPSGPPVVAPTVTAPGGVAGGGGGTMDHRYGQPVAPTPAAPAAPAGPMMIRGPDGKMYAAGSSIGYDQSYDTGKKKGGIGNDFYNTFKQGMLDYYMPQVASKYGDAKDELTYRLARAGTLRSTVANNQFSDLFKQNLEQSGEVRNKADAASADLRSRVASEKAKATAQLYATENPDVAANQATAAIRNITAEQPSMSPLGEIFNVAAIGGANYLKGAQNSYLSKKYAPGNQAGGTIVK